MVVTSSRLQKSVSRAHIASRSKKEGVKDKATKGLDQESSAKVCRKLETKICVCSFPADTGVFSGELS